MNNFDKFVFILCLIVFLLLTVFLSVLIAIIFKQTKRSIIHGLDDSKIIDEYKKKTRKTYKIGNKISLCFSVLLVAGLCGLFVVSITNKVVSEQTGKITTSSLRVVRSESMSKKREENDYLFENNINNQIQMFDLITIHPLPKEEELKLYDIVVYDFDGIEIIHRIIGIEEPNENHSERYFLIKGDANTYQDKFPVKYEQMKGIYRNERIPFLGSFVLFLQSPAGYLCLFLIFVTFIVVPIIDSSVEKTKEKRLISLGYEMEKKKKQIKIGH